MKLIDDWRAVLRRAWSIRLMILAGVLSGGEVVLQIAAGRLDASFPPGVFAALSGVVTSAALVARLLAQNEADSEAKKDGNVK